MKKAGFLKAAMAVMAAIGGLSAVYAYAPSLLLFEDLKSGKWDLRDSDGDTVRSLCLGDPARFIQIEHPGARCNNFVIANEPDAVKVSYSCPGSGHGVTWIRRETAWLIQIETQGIKNGAPFSSKFEAERTGDCS